MIGLFLIYWIGKSFYELAHEHDKSRWGFAIVGVIGYYTGIIIAEVILVFLVEDGVLDIKRYVSGILSLPVGLLTCWLLYRFLKSQWSKQTHAADADVIDRDLLQ